MLLAIIIHNVFSQTTEGKGKKDCAPVKRRQKLLGRNTCPVYNIVNQEQFINNINDTDF